MSTIWWFISAYKLHHNIYLLILLSWSTVDIKLKTEVNIVVLINQFIIYYVLAHWYGCQIVAISNNTINIQNS